MKRKLTPRIKKLIYESSCPEDIVLGLELLKANGISKSGWYYHIGKVFRNIPHGSPEEEVLIKSNYWNWKLKY